MPSLDLYRPGGSPILSSQRACAERQQKLSTGELYLVNSREAVLRLRRCGTYHAHCSTGIRRLFSHKKCEPLSAVARRHGRSSSAQTSGLAWASGGEWLGTCRLVRNGVQAARYLALHGTATSRRQAVDVRADGGAGLRSLTCLFT